MVAPTHLVEATEIVRIWNRCDMSSFLIKYGSGRPVVEKNGCEIW
jgi:hypothetical protein